MHDRLVLEIALADEMCRLKFWDYADNRCFLQAYQPIVADGHPQLRIGCLYRADGTPSSPMVLTQEQVKSLLPLLHHFVKTGDILFDSNLETE